MRLQPVTLRAWAGWAGCETCTKDVGKRQTSERHRKARRQHIPDGPFFHGRVNQGRC